MSVWTLPEERRGSLLIRAARPDDAPLLAELIQELAAYERLSADCHVDGESLAQGLFDPARPVAEALVLEWAGEPAGFALFFHNFSTFLARPGLYLEDLFVRPAFRRRGIARAALVYLARLARSRGCGRMEWSVLDWNTPAHHFYRSLGAAPLEDWTIWRVNGEALARLASPESLE